MLLEKIMIDGNDTRCMFDEGTWHEERQEWEHTHKGTGYKVGYSTICAECLDAIAEGRKVLDANKKIKRVEF